LTDKIIIDHACEILQKTRDGEDLSPWHLKLVELAVNDFLSEKGKENFQKLYASVSSSGGKNKKEGDNN